MLRLSIILCLLLLVVGGLIIIAHRPAIAASDPAATQRLDPALAAQGAVLARIGNCSSCHDGPHGFLAGGNPIFTQFGTFYGANITPDPKTGIGRWSLAAFTRAMRQGVDQRGHQLYPAFPYDHFSSLTDGDIAALYAWLMTRTPIEATRPRNRLTPPLGIRPLVAGWKLLFFDPQPFRSDPAHDAVWNRGAYLAEGLAHCGACHSPRNMFGAEERDHPYAGGLAEGWYAPPLNGHSPAVRGWTVERLETYLRTGFEANHSAAAGPMGEVTANLAQTPEADVHAIATYIASRMATVPAGRDKAPLPDHEAAARAAHPLGAQIFAGACAACHGEGAPMIVAGRPPLALASALHEDSPRDAIQAVLQGIDPPVGLAGPRMPSFAGALDDAQVAEIVGYIRARYDGRPWPDLPHAVSRIRKEPKQ